MTRRTPPRFVPTLTEVFHQGAAAQESAAVDSRDDADPGPQEAPAVASQEQVTARVMERIELALDRSLREAIATVVLEQTDALAPLLRARLEQVVRDVVAEALEEEMRARQRDGRENV
jgi:hypothetical protein